MYDVLADELMGVRLTDRSTMRVGLAELMALFARDQVLNMTAIRAHQAPFPTPPSGRGRGGMAGRAALGGRRPPSLATTARPSPRPSGAGGCRLLANIAIRAAPCPKDADLDDAQAH